MTSRYLLPTLDTDAWTNTSIKVADYLISHFFLSDYSQTHIFPGEVSSFAWILQQYQSDIPAIVSATETRLTTYFERYFKEVIVSVQEGVDPESINNHPLIIYLGFTDMDGVEHTLERIIKYQGLKVNEIISVINKG